MPNREKRLRPAYSLGEEIVNSVSHGLGAALAAAGTAILIVYAPQRMGHCQLRRLRREPVPSIHVVDPVPFFPAAACQGAVPRF